MPDLEVELYGRRVGRLVEGRNTFDFEVDSGAIEHFGIGSSILSVAVPLISRPRRGEGEIRRNFFDELLPEGRARTRLAGNAKITSGYTIGMLARYGRDVAGALKIWDPHAAGEPREPRIEEVSDARVLEILKEVSKAPIGNTSARRMSSLAGVQDKIVMVRTDNETWAEPFDGYASTHIIKPVVAASPTLIFDEEYGARIATHLGLSHTATQIETFTGVSALVIERYDRSLNAPDGRLHQEDFNQALGFTGDGKYEAEGHSGLSSIAQVVRTEAGMDSVRQLLRLTTLSIAVGNYDMHAKNISLLHLPDGEAQLAPAYDVVPQSHVDGLDPDFAFTVNGHYNFERITIDALVVEGESWRVRNASTIVEQTIQSVLDFSSEETPHAGAHHGLAQDIQRICRNLLAGKGAGAPAEGIAGARQQRDTPRPLEQNPGGWGGPVAR